MLSEAKSYNMNLKCGWVESIEQISADDWENIFGTNKIVKSHAFSKAIEQACIPNFQIYYMLVKDESDIVAIVPCFIYSIELEILSGNILKGLVSRIRKVYAKFLRPKVLGLGSPVATCENHIGLASNLSKYQQKIIGDLIVNELLIFSEKAKTNVVIVKEIPESEISSFKDIFPAGFHFYESLPNSFLPVYDNFKPYPMALRKKYRQRFYNAIKKSEQAMVKWELIEDYSSFLSKIYELYANVYTKSRYKFEKLNVDFFANLNKFLPKNSFVLLATNPSNVVIAVEVLLEEDECLIPLYLGLNYEYTENTQIYQNVIFRTLIEAQKRNKKYVIFGQTSYIPKSYSGCLFEKLYIAVYFKDNFFTIFLRLIFPYLFPCFEKPSIDCYKSDFKQDLDIFMKSINRKFI